MESAATKAPRTSVPARVAFDQSVCPERERTFTAPLAPELAAYLRALGTPGRVDSAPGTGLSIDGRGLLIISAPSGAREGHGDPSLVKELDDAVVYVTAKRAAKPRRGEQHGIDYYFYEPEKFRAEIEAGNSSMVVCTADSRVHKDALADTLRDHRIVIVKPSRKECGRSKRCCPRRCRFIMPLPRFAPQTARRIAEPRRTSSASCGCATPRSRWPRAGVRLLWS